MCGRFRGPRDAERVVRFYGVKNRPSFPFNPNVAPTEMTPIVLDDGGGKRTGPGGKKQALATIETL